MQTQTILLILGTILPTLVSSSPVAEALTGKSYTNWDWYIASCYLLPPLSLAPSNSLVPRLTMGLSSSCKPACAWPHNQNKGITGQLRVCDINNRDLPVRDALNAQSGCEKGGTAFLCEDYQPFAVSNDTAYGFAVVFAGADCCRCFEVTWPTARSARGKTMIVQAINVGDVSGDLTAKDIVILTPGGGVGPNDAGCRYQYGTSWGDQYGGVRDGSLCATLPKNLQGGCDWRFNWAGGDVNGWNINYKPVTCPKRLTGISGCSA